MTPQDNEKITVEELRSEQGWVVLHMTEASVFRLLEEERRSRGAFGDPPTKGKHPTLRTF